MGLRTIKESQRRERMRKSPRGFSGLFLQYWLAATFTRSHRQRSIGFSHRQHEKSSELFASSKRMRHISFGVEEFVEFGFGEDGDVEFFGFVAFGAGVGADDDVVGFFADGGGEFAAMLQDEFAGFFAGAIGKAAGEDEGLPC